MIGTYASAALICAASLLVGRAILVLAGSEDGARAWLAPAVGLGALLTVAGFLARAPGHATTATLGVVLLVAVAAAQLWRRGRGGSGELLREGLPVALVTALLLSIPFAV